MDFIKKAVDSAKGSSSGSKASSSNNNKGGTDYVDKVWDAASKKAGRDFDPKTDEKITDGARTLYEKATGKKVSEKISN